MKSALFVTFNNINEANTGGNQGSLRNFKILSESYKTDFYIVESGKFSKLISALVSFYFPPLSYKNKCDIEKLIQKNKYDLVFWDSSLFGRLQKKIFKNHNIKNVAFFHNVEYDFLFARFGNNILKYPYLILAHVNEKLALKYSTLTIALSQRDSTRIEELYHKIPDCIVPVTFDDNLGINQTHKTKEIEERLLKLQPYCLFVGSHNKSNYEGIKWFVDNVSPFLNGIHTVVVGKGLENFRKDLNRENVEIVGFVEDITPYYLYADCVVSPLFSGSGMKIKVVEAMMYGRTVFGTKESFEGFDSDGYPLVAIECNSAEEFILKVNDFFIKNSQSRFNEFSRRLYQDKYSTQVASKLFKSIFKEKLS